MKREWKALLLTLAVLCAAAAALALGGDRKAVRTDAAAEVPAEPEPRCIALTFDDGPRAETTAALLEGLHQRGVRATFFLIGEQIPGNEWLVQWMAEDGHQIGNHTFTHARLQGSDTDTVLQEVNKTEVLLENLLGEGDYWLRPPYGMIGESQKKLIKTPMVYWSIDPEDWKVLDAEKVEQHICERVQNGDIILLHDFYPTSVEAALHVVDRLQAEGYEFVTVEELFRWNGTEPQAGKLYRNAWEER